MKKCGLLAGIVGIFCGLSTLCSWAQTPSPGQVVIPPVRIPSAQPIPQPPLENFLTFDAQQKEVSVTNGTPAADFVFNLTNISSGEVIVNFVQTSCGCTVAKLPSTPWKLAPKEGGQISATMKLMGTAPGGTRTKTLTVNTDKGNKTLFVKATVLAGTPPPKSTAKNVAPAKTVIQ